ncbi:hypothetical protein AMJ40_03550 [candidate division TA06 bacterium DG_26]|uniref:Outer membrane protein beta-barrel domain-containing protein n=1 Tax=candidate division TA06 bacterium DG_26 TaxID=1703771 RepID=A0A0S7WJ64_UNCT6|nr:MAG: hypothetical protein AMJ40_03550 [candidate division TA06 bacterium DG_26]
MRVLCAATIVFLLVTGIGLAEGPKNVVAFQPLGLAWGLANVEYERAFAPKASFAVRADVMYLSWTIEAETESQDASLTGFGGGSSLRFYPLASAPKRAYAGFDIDLVHVTGTNEVTDETGSATFFTVGGVIGWKWLIADAFAVALDIGTMYFAGSLDVGDEDAGLAGLRPKADLYIGLAF